MPIAFNYLGTEAFLWTVGESTIEAVPEIGARLMRWRIAGQDILHWPDTVASASEIPLVYGGNPILFPFPARCFHEGEALHWIAPDGRKRFMPMHGLARQGKFALSKVDERGFEAEFCPDEQAHEAYPFDYRFSVAYRFKPHGISCELVLENCGRQPIPWSAGHHFYFQMPLIDGRPISAHRVQIPATKACLVGPATKGELIPLPPFRPDEALDNPQLANAVIHYGLTSNEARLSVDSQGARRVITVSNGEQCPPPSGYAFVTWSPSLDGPFYCLEPWMGPSNSTEHQVGLQWVPPGRRSSHVVTVKIS
jgi:galactose mutarotase-like enzyme